MQLLENLQMIIQGFLYKNKNNYTVRLYIDWRVIILYSIILVEYDFIQRETKKMIKFTHEFVAFMKLIVRVQI